MAVGCVVVAIDDVVRILGSVGCVVVAIDDVVAAIDVVRILGSVGYLPQLALIMN